MSLAPVAALTALAGSLMSDPTLAAVTNKLLANRGRRRFATPADMAGALFDGSRVTVALRAIAALVLIGAVLATIVGIYRVASGSRGGIEMALSGVYGVLALVATMTVVM